MKRVLIVEDEPLVALEIEQAVAHAGCLVACKVHTLNSALSTLDEETFDAVILDANLRGESAAPIVEKLRELNIRYLIVSGYTRGQLDFLTDSDPILGKPFHTNKLEAAISSIIEH
ncbi:MAG: response regulator [Marinicaulis sp.]|nr:response regulator [Marinicaulis sp.]